MHDVFDACFVSMPSSSCMMIDQVVIENKQHYKVLGKSVDT